jgi:hypothetical protein
MRKMTGKCCGSRGKACVSGPEARVLAVLAVLVAVWGCGYTTEPRQLAGVRTVAVPVLDNQTVYRGLEFELSQLIAREVMSATACRIASADDADALMSGQITAYTKGTLGTDANDQPTERRIWVKLDLKVVERSTGKLLRENTKTECADFALVRGQSEESARAQVMNKLARWAATQLEAGW